MQDEATVFCPYCGERNDLVLDWSGGRKQEYIEDCPVCCRPWNVYIVFNDEGQAEVELTRAQ